jgi:hypothetical protein
MNIEDSKVTSRRMALSEYLPKLEARIAALSHLIEQKHAVLEALRMEYSNLLDLEGAKAN